MTTTSFTTIAPQLQPLRELTLPAVNAWIAELQRVLTDQWNGLTRVENGAVFFGDLDLGSHSMVNVDSIEGTAPSGFIVRFIPTTLSLPTPISRLTLTGSDTVSRSTLEATILVLAKQVQQLVDFLNKFRLRR